MKIKGSSCSKALNTAPRIPIKTVPGKGGRLGLNAQDALGGSHLRFAQGDSDFQYVIALYVFRHRFPRNTTCKIDLWRRWTAQCVVIGSLVFDRIDVLGLKFGLVLLSAEENEGN